MRAVVVALVAIVAAAVASAGCGVEPARSVQAPASPAGDSAKCRVTEHLVPTCGAWWGVAANPPGDGDWDWDRALTTYEETIGRSVDIARYYHHPDDLFPRPDQIARAQEPGRNRLLFLSWKPAGEHTWAQVAGGAADERIDRLAAHVARTYPEPFFLAIHHEPENDVVPAAGSGYTASDYREMFRHVVTRLRGRGVDNAVIVMNYMGIPPWGAQPWFDDLYPGDDVVDWIAQDPYIFGQPDGLYSGGVAALVNRTFDHLPQWPGFYEWAEENVPDKPIMLGEWGVAEVDEHPRFKAAFFDGMLAELENWPRIKAFVYWNHREGSTVGRTLVDSAPGSLAAFQQLSQRLYLNPRDLIGLSTTP